MFCIKCGSQIPDESKFCPKCGAGLKGQPQTASDATPTAAPVIQNAPQVPESATAQETTANNTHAAHIAITATVVVLLLVAIGIGVFAYLKFMSGIAIDESHFPDQGFRTFVTAKLDTNGDNKLSHDEVTAVTVIDLSEQNDVNDVTGIAEFTELQTFNLGSNTVENLDLSQNSNVTKVSTGNGSVADLKLPSGFDVQAGLDGAAGTKVEAGDVIVQADEWSNDNGGKFGPLQRYNGVLYAGISHAAASQQISFEGAVPFFGYTEAFHLANGKAYWVDNDPGNGSNAVSLYSANIDGSDKKILASDVLSHSEMYYSNGYIFFSTFSTKPVLTYLNTTTSERGSLPPEITLFVGICGNRLVVSQPLSLTPRSFDNTLSFFDSATKNVTPIPSSEMSTLGQKAIASDAGVLIANSLEASLYSRDGLPVWSKKAFSGSDGVSKEAFASLFMDESAYYLFYETDYYKHDFTIEKVDLATNEHTYTYFNAPELSAPSVTLQNRDYAIPLIKDGNSFIVSLSQSRGGTSSDYFTYRVSLEDGKAVLLQKASS